MTYKTCKYYSYKHGVKDGKDCLLNPNMPCRCLLFNKDDNCKDYKDKRVSNGKLCSISSTL